MEQTITEKVLAKRKEGAMPKIKRIKHKSLKALRKKARKLFARYIVLRDKGICFTCGKPGNQAGHYIHKNCLDFDEVGNNCQCARCNLWLSGNLGVYAERLIKKYGMEEVTLLRQRANEEKKFNILELMDLIETYNHWNFPLGTL